MIAVVNYGAGNLRSVQNALLEVGARFTIVTSPEELEAAEKIMLPGVGHFGQMMKALEASGMKAALVQSTQPIFGICLGMQALFESSEEAPGVPGLGLLRGAVKRFADELRVPHMGWNAVTPSGSNLLPQPQEFYFANSYYAPASDATTGVCEYGFPFSAVVEQGRVSGVQFHPEKSGKAGLDVLRGFCEC